MAEESYIAIDLKSFYASVECADRGLDPLDTHLVVADESRTDKTICLAVSPSLKAYGLPGRARLFEVRQRLTEINAQRLRNAPEQTFTGVSSSAAELAAHPERELSCIIAPPQMARYMEVSTEIFEIYSQFVSPEDIHVYSVDEVFIHATPYLKNQGLTARDFAMKLIREVLHRTGITATAGIGSNLYLCKIAMDIEAKHIAPDKDGVRIAELDEISYRKKLWNHRPLTDFWRVGKGYAKKLEACGIRTMGEIARTSLCDEELFYRLFGIQAELLIDHAWGWEPCTIEAIKAYRPENNSLSSGQVLSVPYHFEKARLIVREMTDSLVLELLEKRLTTDQLVLTVGYDTENLTVPELGELYTGPVKEDHYGRLVPKPAHGSENLPRTSSSRQIMTAMLRLFDRIVNPRLSVRRMYVVANHLLSEDFAGEPEPGNEQLSLFEESSPEDTDTLERERRCQQAILDIRNKFGKNAILKGINFEEGATAIERNQQVGGHRA